MGCPAQPGANLFCSVSHPSRTGFFMCSVPEMKTCAKCGEIKPKATFSKDARERDGLRSQCKLCARLAAARYRSAYPEKVRQCKAKYRAANPDKLRECNAKRYASNPIAFRVYGQNRRARKIEKGGKLSKNITAKLMKLQRGKCACCGLPLGDNYHQDHIMPLALGGENIDSNMQLLRAACNLQKSAKHPVEFMQSKGFLL